MLGSTTTDDRTNDVVLARVKELSFCPVVSADLEWKFLGKRNDLKAEDRAEQWFDRVHRQASSSSLIVKPRRQATFAILLWNPFASSCFRR